MRGCGKLFLLSAVPQLRLAPEAGAAGRDEGPSAGRFAARRDESQSLPGQDEEICQLPNKAHLCIYQQALKSVSCGKRRQQACDGNRMRCLGRTACPGPCLGSSVPCPLGRQGTDHAASGEGRQRWLYYLISVGSFSKGPSSWSQFSLKALKRTHFWIS